jgi:putative cardiolipin synthase
VLVYDAPEKIENGRSAPDDLMIPALLAAMGVPERRLDIVTPYFVISKAWTDVFTSWASRGVELRILTNSLAANDPPIAHAGYLVRRRALLLGGVQLLELKAGAADPEIGDRRAEAGASGSPATLHAKTAAIDGQRIFVGSLNLDQRSAYLNTEMGMVIESPPLADALHRMFDEQLVDHAYRVTIGEDARLRWIERTPDGEVIHDSEPQIGVIGWLSSGIVALLPLDWLL